jgi:hydrogenase nickel incorporation protein HypA/HybF
MHELSICEGIVEEAVKALAGFRRTPQVSQVTVRIGRLTRIVPDSLRQHFDLLVPGTPLEGATLNIEEVPIAGRCVDCAASFEMEVLSLVCPECGSGLVELTSGRELSVVSLETAEEVSNGD